MCGTILLTHIHLDHAGATGTLLQRLPQAVAYVHERGAPHMVDPTKLLASATRLYGANMDRFWGEFLPCPRIGCASSAAASGSILPAARSKCAYTPGHASHHVSFFDTTTGIAYVGDTAGIRVAGGLRQGPHAAARHRSRALGAEPAEIEAWRPTSLVLTHFGRVDDVSRSYAVVPRRALAAGGAGARDARARGDRRGADSAVCRTRCAPTRNARFRRRTPRRRKPRRRSISSGRGWRGIGGRRPRKRTASDEAPVNSPPLIGCRRACRTARGPVGAASDHRNEARSLPAFPWNDGTDPPARRPRARAVAQRSGSGAARSGPRARSAAARFGRAESHTPRRPRQTHRCR